MTTARDVIAKALRDNSNISLSLHCADAILLALDKAGYAVVPKEPTADMLVEGNLVIARNRLFATDIYKAMIEAAKETP